MSKSEKQMDNEGVENFTIAMQAKLAQKRIEGYGGWHNPKDCSIMRLEGHLIRHIGKGIGQDNLLDIANFCMMIWNRKRND